MILQASDLSQPDPKRELYMSRLNMISSQVSSLATQLSSIEADTFGLDDRLNRLPSRIGQIRKMNYRALPNIEKDEASLLERWTSIGPTQKEIVRNSAAILRPEISSLEGEVSQRRMDTLYDSNRLLGLETRMSTAQIRVSDLGSQVARSLGDLKGKIESLEQDLTIAESTVSLTSQASFPWKDGESPILAVEAKDMNKDLEGVMTLTNLRFIFESEKEVVLKKRLFIATEKKKIRETVLEQPIGTIGNMTKGRVGLLAGAGLFISFKPETRLQDLKLDVKGHEADWAIRFYNYITSGQAEVELSAAPGAEAQAAEKPKITQCPKCGAPFTDEIYRGQTSIRCRYCGAVTPIS